MREQTKRWLIGLTLLVASVPVFAAAEAGLDYIRTIQGQSENHFGWMFRRYLVPWTELALCVPIAVVLARRFSLSGPGRAKSIAVHIAGGVTLSVAHLMLDTIDSNVRFNANLSLVG